MTQPPRMSEQPAQKPRASITARMQAYTDHRAAIEAIRAYGDAINKLECEVANMAGRPSYVQQASNNLDAAIARLGEVKAKGHQLKELDSVYEVLLVAYDQLQLSLTSQHAA